MSTVKNLWGELPLAQVIRTPVVILREQATQLTELTKGLLEGEVATQKLEGNSSFHSRLTIIAPVLDNYRFAIIDTFHNIMLYPVTVNDIVNGKRYECQSEEHFTNAVGEILSSATVHKAIAALLSQSTSEKVA